jgi:hypothetical protein
MPEHVAGHSVSRATYQKRGCRCPGCVEANAAYTRTYRAGNRAQVNANRRAYQAKVRAAAASRRTVKANQRAYIRHLGKPRREAIEQAIARGVAAERICTEYDLTPEQLRAILAAMLDEGAA